MKCHGLHFTWLRFYNVLNFASDAMFKSTCVELNSVYDHMMHEMIEQVSTVGMPQTFFRSRRTYGLNGWQGLDEWFARHIGK